jgi:hypothetical protein
MEGGKRRATERGLELMSFREALMFWFARGVAEALGGLLVVAVLLAIGGIGYLLSERWRSSRASK